MLLILVLLILYCCIAIYCLEVAFAVEEALDLKLVRTFIKISYLGGLSKEKRRVRGDSGETTCSP